MYALALMLLLAAADPPGTVVLELTAGKTTPLETPAHAQILCDDLSVVTPEFTPDGNSYVLRALKPGSTLCGVWLSEQVPAGLYRVNVKAPGGSADAGTEKRPEAPKAQ